MPHPLRLTASLFTTLLLSSCAVSYVPVQPAQLTGYQVVDSPGTLQVAYQANALGARGRNAHYVRRARKRGYEVLALRVVNTGSTDAVFSPDAALHYGSLVPVPVTQAAHDIRQSVAVFALYALLDPYIPGSRTNGPNGPESSHDLFLPIGPIIAGGNMYVAIHANQNFRQELQANDLSQRTIHPGETVYGLVSLHTPAAAPAPKLEVQATTH